MAKELSLEELKDLARKYAYPSALTYVIVGNAKTQLDKLNQLGIDNIIMVDENLKPICAKRIE